MNDKENKISVLFVCTGNSCRSQMAEGFLRTWGGDKFDVHSAGTSPEKELSRRSEQVMSEIGIDITGQYPKSLDIFKEQDFDWVITLCDHARDFCPMFSGKDGNARKLHWSIADPHTATHDPVMSMKAYRTARDIIGNHIAEWLESEYGIKVVFEHD
jgi:arsenate reductase (thioredoxin)